MEIPGRVQNGVVVVDGLMPFPEGAAVMVTLRSRPMIRVAKNQRWVELPLVPCSSPGSIRLTNEMIADILMRKMQLPDFPFWMALAFESHAQTSPRKISSRREFDSD